VKKKGGGQGLLVSTEQKKSIVRKTKKGQSWYPNSVNNLKRQSMADRMNREARETWLRKEKQLRGNSKQIQTWKKGGGLSNAVQ